MFLYIIITIIYARCLGLVLWYGLVLAFLNASTTGMVIRGGDNGDGDDIRMNPTTGTQCHTLLRTVAGVLLYATLYGHGVTQHGLW